jgi:hypothetical protein
MRLSRTRSLKAGRVAQGSCDRPLGAVVPSFVGRRQWLRLEIAVGRREREPSLPIRGRRRLSRRKVAAERTPHRILLHRAAPILAAAVTVGHVAGLGP